MENLLPAATAEFIVEIHVVVNADSFTDAEELGRRAAAQAWKVNYPRSAGRATISNIYVADIRDD
jgi:hypothetical protein